MFILKKEATFTHPIKFYTPADGGTQKEETFDAVFKILPQSRINEIGAQAQKKEKELKELKDRKIKEIEKSKRTN